MRRHLATAAALLVLSACKVERTPREFYTQRDPARVDQQEAEGEIRARVRNFVEGLGRGDRAGAVDAVNPSPGVLVIGADAHDGLARFGPAGLAAALDSLELPVPAVARTPDLRIGVGLREGTGWFSTPIELLPAGGGAPPLALRASGIFTQARGAWQLEQIHLSRAYVPPDTVRADSAAADSARGDTTARDSS